ncbi:tegument protein UL14 [Human alphaherpesvirus 3]|uniref:ORF46 n=1 Tax=Human herpesvirus 3 TaxID=10335 RepID=A0A0F7GIB0_HHV3|nr:ORF46 [Human alphaherpesvirus 3]AQT34098.1 tegument protein UL14 [Human alphaherpesvirus 3]QCA42964.1 ORF46 [Human alphaherpesvirus 3]QCA45884.1 ORF46 [Human alphaherpesvirus 3]WJM99297.1 tegument protein UL14 [Human alphaherpesvirus 3]
MSGHTPTYASHRRNRVKLVEAHNRAGLFKERTLDLIRGGASVQDPAFVYAFTAAKEACADLNNQLRSAARIASVEQKIRDIQSKVEEQTSIQQILNTNRRYIAPDFIRGLDKTEDDNTDNIDRLEDAVGPNIEHENQTWFGEDDEALLTQWMLTTHPPTSKYLQLQDLCVPTTIPTDMNQMQPQPISKNENPPTPHTDV